MSIHDVLDTIPLFAAGDTVHVVWCHGQVTPCEKGAALPELPAAYTPTYTVIGDGPDAHSVLIAAPGTEGNERTWYIAPVAVLVHADLAQPWRRRETVLDGVS